MAQEVQYLYIINLVTGETRKVDGPLLSMPEGFEFLCDVPEDKLVKLIEDLRNHCSE